MEGLLLVDGYNVLNAWPGIAKLKDEDLAHARDCVIAALSEFRSLSGLSVILVFDAHQVKGGIERRESHAGIEVVYTKEGETADEWIERFVARQKETFKDIPLFVTTSDWLEQRIVSAQGAYRVTPLELYNELQRLKKESQGSLQRVIERNPLDNHLSEHVKEVFENWRRRKFID